MCLYCLSPLLKKNPLSIFLQVFFVFFLSYLVFAALDLAMHRRRPIHTPRYVSGGKNEGSLTTLSYHSLYILFFTASFWGFTIPDKPRPKPKPKHTSLSLAGYKIKQSIKQIIFLEFTTVGHHYHRSHLLNESMYGSMYGFESFGSQACTCTEQVG